MRSIEIIVSPDDLHNTPLHKNLIAQETGLHADEISCLVLEKRSVDARAKKPRFVLRYKFYTAQEKPEEKTFEPGYTDVSDKKPVYIAGMGPAGMFAALRCLELGLKPILLERGKEIRARRRDIAGLIKRGQVDADSNYCFGEGGAGTFSDGKLYTRSTKRGNVSHILHTLVYHGASPDILSDAHPHIGTNRLPLVVESIRHTILKHGGEIHFNTQLKKIITQNGKLKGIETSTQGEIETENLILATGHSARDIFEMLHRQQIDIRYKPFALGLRAEHPQHLIDSIQYHCPTRHPNLPAASYNLLHRYKNRGVYSFCMCPGGVIAPCATENGEIVTNGWSPSGRNNPFANAGIVVEVQNEDIAAFGLNNPLAGMYFQQQVEKHMFLLGGNNLQKQTGQCAPAQRMGDFVNGKHSTTLLPNSYLAGVKSASLHEELPASIVSALQDGFRAFGKKMKGYLSNEAMLVGIESRTSSPVQIPRNKETLEHVSLSGLYPCGEGAGYAGGIVSAAIDGVCCAEALHKKLTAVF